jgi:transcriptional regulator with XRE-family HTH domain
VDLRTVIAKNIRGYRLKTGLTQEALAGKVKLGANHLARIERAEEGLTLKRWDAICKVLKIQPHLLLIPESYREKSK